MDDSFDPQWNALIEKIGPLPPLPDKLDDVYTMFNQAFTHFSEMWPDEPSVEIINTTMNSGIAVRIYKPAAAAQGGLPVGVFLHAGGTFTGNLDTEHAHCRIIAKEMPWGCGLSRGVQLAKENASKFGGEASKTFILAGSGGSKFAEGVTLRLLEAGRKDELKGLVIWNPMLMYPEAVPGKYRSLYKSHIENADAAIVNWKNNEQAFALWRAEPDSPKTFAMHSPHLASFPPTSILSCSKDCLRDCGKVLKAGLKDQGVAVQRKQYEGMPHYFHVFVMIEKSRDFLVDIVQGCRWVLEQSDEHR